jgi:hypothetical protein
MNESASASSSASSSSEELGAREGEEVETRGRDWIMEFFNSTQRCKLKLSLLSPDRFSLERAREKRLEDWDDICGGARVVGQWL